MVGGGGGGVREQVQHQVASLARPDQDPAHSSDWGKHPAPATLDLASISNFCRQRENVEKWNAPNVLLYHPPVAASYLEGQKTKVTF